MSNVDPMKKICVVFFSSGGTTALLADAIAEGIRDGANISAELHRIEPTHINDGRYTDGAIFDAIDSAEAIVFGTPTYMGGPSAQFKAFADSTSSRWSTGRWHGKLAAGFTIGASTPGEQSITVQYLSVLAAQHGMLWVDLDRTEEIAESKRPGNYTGLVAQAINGAVREEHMATARRLGRKMAELVGGSPLA